MNDDVIKNLAHQIAILVQSLKKEGLTDSEVADICAVYVQSTFAVFLSSIPEGK